MAKLSARGRHCVVAVIREWKNPAPCRRAEHGEDYNLEVEWRIEKRRLMSDGKVLINEKWKHFQHEKPFEKGWKLSGRKEKVTDEKGWLECKLRGGWQIDSRATS